ncbi:MAG TPA: Uma2 family endonuclease [Urbifossiella sp.]|nr:Uma2 family endonuclease [Urbifossiella sp.]
MEPFTEDEFMYPSADHMAKAETDHHRRTVSDLIARLDARYASDPNVYVSGGIKVYWETWNPYDLVVPDCFVAFGVPKRDRDKYLAWQEPALPAVVFEVFSTESADDLPFLLHTYQKDVKVDELFLFDPFRVHEGAALAGYSRVGNELRQLEPADGGLTSRRLGVKVSIQGSKLLLLDIKTGAALLTAPEREAAALRAELGALREIRLAR